MVPEGGTHAPGWVHGPGERCGGVGVHGPSVGVHGPGWGAWSRGVGVASQHALRQPPPVNRMTDRCKNITFATSLWTVIKS